MQQKTHRTQLNLVETGTPAASHSLSKGGAQAANILGGLMSTRLVLRLAFCTGALFAVACDNNIADDDAGAQSQPPAPVARIADPSLPENKIEMTGNDQMKFDVTKIEAKPNQKVTVTLKNIGTMPKMSMGHNFVLLERGMDLQNFMEASAVHMAAEFIAPDYRDKVIAHTKLLGPGESDTVTFVAPSTPGEYPYLCSFPGHCTIGMKGILTIQ